MMSFTEIFHLLVEQTNVYYRQHLDKQAGPNRRLPDIIAGQDEFCCLSCADGTHIEKHTT
jgi:hypothetical protein